MAKCESKFVSSIKNIGFAVFSKKKGYTHTCDDGGSSFFGFQFDGEWKEMKIRVDGRVRGKERERVIFSGF